MGKIHQGLYTFKLVCTLKIFLGHEATSNIKGGQVGAKIHSFMLAHEVCEVSEKCLRSIRCLH